MQKLEEKQCILKMTTRIVQPVQKKRYMDGQQAHAKMINVISYLENSH